MISTRRKAAALTANLVDNLPAGITIAPAPNIQASAGCDLASVSATAGGTSLTYLSGGTIPASGGCSIAVDVTSTTIGTVNNEIAISELQTTIGKNTVATDSDLTVAPIPITVGTSFTPSTVLLEGISTLALSLSNHNAMPATLTTDLVDQLPANLVIATSPNIQATAGCNVADVTAAAGTDSVIYQSGSGIPVGGCDISVDVSSDTPGQYQNQIPAGALTTDLGNNADPADAQLNVVLPTPKSVPVMSPPGLAMLIGLLSLAAWYRLARARRRPIRWWH